MYPGWRDVTLASLGIKGSLLEKLAEQEIITIGHVADYCKFKKLTDLRGIGQAKADLIQEAIDKYWATRRAEIAAASAQIEVSEAREELWKGTPLSELGIVPAHVTILEAAGIRTVGEMLAYVRERELACAGLGIDDVRDVRTIFGEWYQKHVLGKAPAAPASDDQPEQDEPAESIDEPDPDADEDDEE